MASQEQVQPLPRDFKYELESAALNGDSLVHQIPGDSYDQQVYRIVLTDLRVIQDRLDAALEQMGSLLEAAAPLDKAMAHLMSGLRLNKVMQDYLEAVLKRSAKSVMMCWNKNNHQLPTYEDLDQHEAARLLEVKAKREAASARPDKFFRLQDSQGDNFEAEVKEAVADGSLGLKCEICFLRFDSVTEYQAHAHSVCVYREQYMEAELTLGEAGDDVINESESLYEDPVENEDDHLDGKTTHDMEDKVNGMDLPEEKHFNRIQDKNVARSTMEDGLSKRSNGKAKKPLHHTCTECNKTFRRRLDFEDHLRTHSGEKPYVCEICSRSFANKSNLNRHHRSHTGLRPHKCDVCGKGFSRLMHLKEHRASHTGEKFYICKICGKGFCNAAYFHTHEKYHSKVNRIALNAARLKDERKDGKKVKKRRPEAKKDATFTCELCNKVYTTSSGLQYHLTTHRTEPEFQCEVCNKKFFQKQTYRRHLRIHTGETPYECEVCKKRFNQLYNMKRHSVIHMDEMENKADIMGKGVGTVESSDAILEEDDLQRKDDIHDKENAEDKVNELLA